LVSADRVVIESDCDGKDRKGADGDKSTLLTTLRSYCQPYSYSVRVVRKVCVSAVGRSAGALVSAGQVHRLAALATVASGPFDSCIESLSGLLGGACLPLQRSDGRGSLR
jgi:hypothetical protein